MSFEIHRLEAEDIERMRAMMTLFGEAFDDPERYAGAPPGEGYLRALLSRSHVVALAACRGDDVVGGLVAYVLDKFEREVSEVYIYDLAVAEPFRRRGIARALIRRLAAIAADLGAPVIFVQADRDDEPAIRLYAGLGVREDVLHFDIDVTSMGAED